jgi:hypothetical protein
VDWKSAPRPTVRAADAAPPPGSAVALATPDDVVAKAAHTLANPVAAGLVRHGKDWPGVWLAPSLDGKPIVARRPDAFDREEEEAAAKLEEEKRTFASAENALAAATSERPTSVAPRRKLNPRIAARDTATRIAALFELKAFRKAHREALEKFRKGARDTVFPAGTYLMRVLHGIPCHTPS